MKDQLWDLEQEIRMEKERIFHQIFFIEFTESESMSFHSYKHQLKIKIRNKKPKPRNILTKVPFRHRNCYNQRTVANSLSNNSSSPYLFLHNSRKDEDS